VTYRAPSAEPVPALTEPSAIGGALRALPDNTRAFMHQFTSDLRAGRSGAMAIVGPRGPVRTGLTRQAAAKAVWAGVTVLVGRGTPAEQGWPFGVAGQLADRLPGSRRTVPAGHTAAAGAPRSVRVQQLSDMFLRASQRRPLVLVVEDAQWCDAPSLDVLATVLRRKRGPGLSMMVTLTGSTSEVPPSCADLLTLMCSPTVHGRVIQLGPADDSGGPPAPPRLPSARSVPEPTWGLAPGPLALLRSLAVCQDFFPLHLVYALAGLDEAPAASPLRDLRATGLVTGGTPPRLTQLVSAGRVLSAMPDTERQTLFERAAELGQRAALSDTQLAGLLMPARPSGAGWAVATLRRVAAACRARGEHRQAVSHLARVLQEPLTDPERAAVLVEIGAASFATDPEAADRFLVQALHVPGNGHDTRQRALAADLLLARGDAGAAKQALGTACRAADTDERERRTLRALHWFAEQAEQDGSALDGLVPDPEPLPDDPGDPSGLAAATWQAALSGGSAARVEALGRAVLDFPARDLPLYPRIFTCLALAATGSTEVALTGLDSCLAEARRRRMPPLVGLALLARCEVNLRFGFADRARRDLALADAEMPPGSWHPATEPFSRALRGRVLAASGDFDEAARIVADGCAPELRQQVAWPQLLFVRAALHLAGDRPDAALADLRECGRWLLARGWTNPVLVPWRCLGAVAHARIGRPAEARRFAVELRRVMVGWETPTAHALADLASGTLAEGPTAVRLLKRAVARLHDPLLQALAVRQLASAQAGLSAPDT
jgi:hypothetical protein